MDLSLAVSVSRGLPGCWFSGGYRWFPGPRDKSLAARSLGPLSFICLCSLHSTCRPATSQLPPAFKVALDGYRWGAGLPGLLANSSLNSPLGMQDGPAWSRSTLRALASPGTWPSSGAQRGELFLPPLFTQTRFRGVSPGGGEARGGGLRGHWVLFPRPAARRSRSWVVGADGGGPLPTSWRMWTALGEEESGSRDRWPGAAGRRRVGSQGLPPDCGR